MNLHICKLHPNAITPTYGTDGAACFERLFPRETSQLPTIKRRFRNG